MEVTGAVLGVASEGYLRPPAIKDIYNLLIGDIAHLVVLMNDLSILVTDTALLGRHQGITRLILGANVAVDSSPTLFAFAIVTVSQWPIASICQRTAYYNLSLALEAIVLCSR